MSESLWAIDSDGFPVWLRKVTRKEADEMISKGEASGTLPAEPYKLTWACRHGQPARWYLFPKTL